MSVQRWAKAYLVIEDRYPHLGQGNATISACYQTRDAAIRAAGGKEARVLPVRIDLNEHFFVQPPVVVTVPDDFGKDEGRVA